MLALPQVAAANNGYFQYGYGNLSKSMAGLGYALPQDALIPATNPAGLTLIGSRIDVGIEWIAPLRNASIEGNRLVTQASADGSWDADDIAFALVPEFGYSRAHGSSLSYGLAVYGNGGLNTVYSENPYEGFGANGDAGVDLAQLFVAPAVSLRVAERHSIGLAVNLVYQRFKAYGLDVFAATQFPGPYSESPDKVTSNGYDGSYGLGYRLGWLAEPIDDFTIGLSWQPRTKMTRFDRYRGLFRDQGRFDIPENYGAGIAYRWAHQLALAFDVQRIRYDGVASVGTPLQPLVEGELLGSDEGPGFGWRAMTVYKFGVAGFVSPALRVAAGYSYSRQPVPADQTLFSILAPGVIEEHYSAGLSYRLGAHTRLSAYYCWAPETIVRGKDSIPPNQLLDPLPPASLGGGEASIGLGGQLAGLAFGYEF